MPKLTETYTSKLPYSKSGTVKHWDSEVRGLGLFVGKRSKTWYFQKDVGGQTKRILIGRHPIVSAQIARQAALEYALEWSRGSGKMVQQRVPTLEAALESYLARPKLRSGTHKRSVRQQFDLHLKDWMKRPLDEIDQSPGGRSAQVDGINTLRSEPCSEVLPDRLEPREANDGFARVPDHGDRVVRGTAER